MKRVLTFVSFGMLLLLAAACAAPTPVPTSPPAPTAVPPTAAAVATNPPTAPTSAPSTAGTAAPTTSSPAGTVTLNIICRCVAGGVNDIGVKWLTTYVIPNFQDMMAKKGTPVKVNLVQFGGSDEQLKQQYALDLKVGQGSDVMSFDGFWVPEFVAGGLIKPLDVVAGPSVDSWDGWSHIAKNIQALLSYQGKVYGIPAGTDARAIWFRKDLFQKAGLPTDWQPKSWDDILSACQTITSKLTGVTCIQLNAGTAMGEATTLQGWYMVVLGAGANVYDFKTNKYIVSGKPILDALNFYKTIYIDKKYGDARLQLLKDGRQQSFLDFRDGKIAMLVEGDYFWRSVLAAGDTKLANRDQLVGWAKMPAEKPGMGINGQDFVTASGGTGNILNPNTKHPAEAWALLSFMNSKAALDSLQTLQPVIRARDDVAVPNDPVLTAFAKTLLPITTIRPSDPNYPKVSVAIQQMTEQVVSGTSPQQAAQTYESAVIGIAGKDNTEPAP
ncbi:MAG: extracellular solute-binding protein [Chloroflexi bacterium]|nr:extracellular solute-binding protein [Chloroflexota bacterium]